MKNKYLRGILTIVALVILAGCGSTPGSPGSSGDTGVMLSATIAPKAAGSLSTGNVDAIIHLCSAGPPPVYETLADQLATVTINAQLLSPDSTVPVGNIYIDKYTVEFKRSDDSVGAPPILTDTRYQQIFIKAPTGTGTTTVTQDIIFIDVPRKVQYATDILNSAYSSINNTTINNYTAIFTFEGQNDFGEHFSFQTHLGFSIGDYDTCGG